MGMREEMVSQASIPLESCSGGGVDGDPARLVKLGLAHLQESLVQVNIPPVQTDRLAQTHSCNRQHTEQGRVGSGSQPFGRRDLLGGLD